eukprot:1475129-Amphidinium_carterae.1
MFGNPQKAKVWGEKGEKSCNNSRPYAPENQILRGKKTRTKLRNDPDSEEVTTSSSKSRASVIALLARLCACT